MTSPPLHPAAASLACHHDSEDEFAHLTWDFRDSDLDFADPPPGGWHLTDSGIDTPEEDKPKHLHHCAPCSPTVLHATKLQPVASSSHLTIELRPPPPTLPTQTMPPTSSIGILVRTLSKSPMAMRKKSYKGLSVSDIASLAWCELQVDYGVRGKRYLPVAERPRSFTSREGKTITVQHEVANENSKRLDQGSVVHKKLERELKPVEVIVRTTTNEEKWAVRLMNLIVCLRALQTLGACREMPVFGFLEGEFVLGVIDEVVRKLPSLPSSPPDVLLEKRARRKARRKQKRSSSAAQTGSDTSPPPPSVLQIPETQASVPKHALFVLDSKTRGRNLLPLERDTYGTKIQLMIYHRLLSGLVFQPPGFSVPSASTGFDFQRVWTLEGVEPHANFSAKYTEQLLELALANDVLVEPQVIGSIGALVSLYEAEVASLRETTYGLSRTLEVVYRMRESSQAEFATLHQRHNSEDKGKRKRGSVVLLRSFSSSSGSGKGSGKGKKRPRRSDSRSSSPSMQSDEDPQLQAAISASLAKLQAATPTTASDDDTQLRAAIALSLSGQQPTSPARVNPSLSVIGLETKTDISSRPQQNSNMIVEQPVNLDLGSGAETEAESMSISSQASCSPSPSGSHSRQVAATASSTDRKSTAIANSQANKIKSGSISSTAVIGSTRFTFDARILDKFVTNAVGYWHGRREPDGVDIEDIHRCNFCEYINDCEWRAKKAVEIRKSSYVDSSIRRPI
ncbi:exonuclease V a 5' deoxyribonuclease-domain-containing protein [Auriculariales sp. MPI-PUGE-AT-0066]|nr:exonuclease V a 5' deoxyribonuclease-domain-containing protein [Auriculariales sp. MPI-PUGE-AT-0066]